MKVSIISPTVYVGSTMVDDTLTVSDMVTGTSPNCVAVELKKGLEVRAGTKIYEYTGEDKSIPNFDVTTNYAIGDVVIKDCKLQVISGKEGDPTHTTTRPKEPEEYSAFDTDIDFDAWSHRYLRISNTHIANKSMGSLGIYKGRWYYIFFEDRPHHPNCGFRFSAKDLNKTGERDASWYLRTCLRRNTSNKFELAKDKKAVINNWGAPGMPKVPTINAKSLIIRDKHSYIRTHLDLPIEYTSVTVQGNVQYSLTEVLEPTDIVGFKEKRNITALSVFDKKDYTTASVYPESGEVSWTFINTEDVDCIGLSKVIADTVDIQIVDMDGNSVFVLTDYPIYNELSKKRFEEAVTTILYTSDVIKGEHSITVTLRGSYISLGDISVGDTLDLGFTNLDFNNDYRDFSPYEQDQWGNIIYIDGVRVKRFSGTVDLPISDYDLLYREMNAIGGKELIINGSDSINNTPTNSVSIFQSTMMVGRFKSIKLKTTSKTNKIGDIATYSFEIEERV